MPSYDSRCIHFPYCIKKLENGHHVVLNRDYKPLGFKTTEHVKYENYPIGVRLAGLTAKKAAELSCKGSPDTNEIFLYADDCIPTKGAQHMRRYLERLAILAKLKVARQRQ